MLFIEFKRSRLVSFSKVIRHVLLLRRSVKGVALLVAVIAVACRPPPPPRSPAEGLPSFGAEDATLLDDSFSGHLFETAFVPGVAGDDPHFNDRVRLAEDIWVVKVATVSREGSVDDKRRYSLVFRPLASLAGPLPTEPVSLTISARDPAFHWLDRVGGAWVGKEILLMTRAYRASDEVVLHFHGEPNLPELRARIALIRAASGPKR